eukprot:TRINITY_DN43719_c0_g1_i1.p1 TRINITY_DN43719_c0_g1~~TRINITY_DN43719_c0_g1_i1.p1  ORF type:complete len:274 (+),score=66.78 TRINITY_DN43719_c0_g1_i1:51-872(+)
MVVAEQVDFSFYLKIGIALVVGTVSTIGLVFLRNRAMAPADPNAPLTEEQKAKRKKEVEMCTPKNDVFTLHSLSIFDGRRLPIYVGVCGKVLDVSTSENIRYGEGYGKLWAGKDATYALALTSLKPEDANKMDFKLSDFSEEQRKALSGWYKHFTTKYRIVGTMEEYKDWDFSEIEEEARYQKPFGAEAEERPSAASPMSAAKAEDAVFLARNDRVIVTSSEDSPEFIGAIGTLTDFVPSMGRFAVEFEKGRGTAHFRPNELLKSTGKAKVSF